MARDGGLQRRPPEPQSPEAQPRVRPRSRATWPRQVLTGRRSQVSRTFGVGIVGAGTIGKVHAAELASVEDAELVAIANRGEEAGRELAGSHGVEWHPDL